MPRTIEGIQNLKDLVGQEIGVSDWLTITQPMIDAFAEATRDHQWIHVDPERAKRESPYGTTIAHGFFTLSLLPHLHQQAVQLRDKYRMGVNYGLNRVRFTNAVPAGARIRSKSVLRSVEEVAKAYQLTWEITVEIEGQAKPALVAEWLGRLYP